MLVLSRKTNQEIVIPELGIKIMVIEIRGDKVRIGVKCPKQFICHRHEIWEEIVSDDPRKAEAAQIIHGLLLNAIDRFQREVASNG